ncbi:MAG: hypothetical protein ABIK65_06440 [Candidatus Eisenbacteria bacterium]
MTLWATPWKATRLHTVTLRFLPFILTMLLGISLSSCGLKPDDGDDPEGESCPLSAPEVNLAEEELSIWSLVIESLYPRSGMVVLRDSTRYFPIRGWLVDSGDSVSMSVETRDAYVIANEKRCGVPTNIPLDKPYVLGPTFGLPGPTWEEFWELYPESGGIAAVSKVGFGIESCEAVVYYERECGILCGRGYIVLLSYDAGQWNIAWVINVWVSKKEYTSALRWPGTEERPPVSAKPPGE